MYTSAITEATSIMYVCAPDTHKETTNHIQLLTVFPYSHEVLGAPVSAPSVVFLKAMLLQQPESSTKLNQLSQKHKLLGK